MRYLVLSIFALSCNALSAGQSPSKPEEPVKKEQTQQRKMIMPDQVDQHDTTDIFAIPFDTSEAEEDIEIENLDKLSEKLQAAKKAKEAQQQK